MNTDIQVTIADIQIFKRIIAGGVENCLVLMRDKSIPLEERWSLFEQVAEFLPIASWGSDTAWSAIGFDHISDYDEFNTERHQTVKLVDRYEMLREMHGDYEENNEDLWFNAENIDQWREQVLQDGRQGFIYDW